MTSPDPQNPGLAGSSGPDLIDALAGIAPGSRLDRLRGERPDVKVRTQSSYDALFRPADPGGLPLADRFAVARRVAELNGDATLEAHYSEGLKAVHAAGAANALSSRRDAMLRHAEMLTREPKAAQAAALESLQAEGLTPAVIVTLSQIIAFVNYQVRVLAGLKLLTEVA